MKRDILKDKKRIVIKIGSSSLTHSETQEINYYKLEKLARILSDLRGQGKEIVLVSSGAQAVGRIDLKLSRIPDEMPKKQALAAIGQAKLMMIYQKLFSEYGQTIAQILMTKNTMLNKKSRENAHNTFMELLKIGVIPIVNENDTVATDEIEFGDNDHLSAFVLALIEGDLLIILSDIDGFYTDDPSTNPDARLIECVEKVDLNHLNMGKETSSSSFGTGGMKAKVDAARIATEVGADMVLVNGKDISIIHRILEGENVGTIFMSNKNKDFDLIKNIEGNYYE